LCDEVLVEGSQEVISEESLHPVIDEVPSTNIEEVEGDEEPEESEESEYTIMERQMKYFEKQALKGKNNK